MPACDNGAFRRMKPAPKPENERERLEALAEYDILDTPSEAEFDDFTRLATQICGTPIAVITFLDEGRQWFKSKLGIESASTPREWAFCGYALHEKDVLEVPNALEDERFRDNPLVQGEPNIRFYAGAPLVTLAGLALGTLCVIDRTPRRLTSHQRESLGALARQVMRQLELRRAQRRELLLKESLEHVVAERTLALHESEARFSQLAEQSTEVFWFVGVNPERLLYMSPAVKRIWGRPPEYFYSEPRRWLEGIHPADRSRIEAAFERLLTGQDDHFEQEYRVVHTDGSIHWVLDSGNAFRENGRIVRFGGIAKEITESKQAETQRLRTQRLESLGTLAGGIAHDLNNALAPILMGIELLRAQNPEATQLIDTIEASARHGAGMVRQLLTFARGVDGARVLIQPRHLIDDLKRIVNSTFPKNITLRVNYPRRPPTVLGDPTQLHQVLLNLCVNARDAMPNGGTLTLDVDSDAVSATDAVGGEARPGRYVTWRVGDTGTGIAPEILERIFEPFFSTKGPEKGTGLGLSTVLGIVRSHGGFIRVKSTVGKGSVFSVYLPAHDAEDVEPAPAEPLQPEFRGNGEMVLVVDDVADVRTMARSVLTALNFRVVTAVDGTDALLQAAEHREEIRAIVTDFHMPYLDGLGLVRVLKRMLPDAALIVASGRLEERDANELRTLGVGTVLDKPFTQEALVQALKKIFVA